MIQHERRYVRSQIPPHLRQVAYIAGGAAIAPHTAGDSDVWVIGRYYDELAEHFEYNEHAEVVGDDEDGESIPSEHPGSRLVANLTDPANGRKYQVLVAEDAETIEDVLAHFDLSVHQWAVSLDQHASAYKGFDATLPSQEIRVLHRESPVNTLVRLAKLTARYGWELEGHPDIERLRASAAQKGKGYEFNVTYDQLVASKKQSTILQPSENPFG